MEARTPRICLVPKNSKSFYPDGFHLLYEKTEKPVFFFLGRGLGDQWRSRPPTAPAYLTVPGPEFNLGSVLKLGIELHKWNRINSIFQGLKYPTHPTPRAGGGGGGGGLGVGGYLRP